MSDAVEWRVGLEADASVIRNLTREAYAKWVPVIGREPMPMQVNYADAVLTHRFDLLSAEGALAALIETVSKGDHLLIENVAVAPRFQRRGFGRLLMAHAEQLASSSGYREIRLYTNKLFAENVRLYHRLGYETDQEQAFAGGVAVHMSKPL